MEKKIIAVLISIPIIFIVASLKADNEQLNDVIKSCNESIAQLDDLYYRFHEDYKSMSLLATKHINSQQLNYDDPKVFDDLFINNDKLMSEHDQLMAVIKQNCH